MHQFFERGTRGGISMISHRYAQANNQLIENIEQYDPDEPISYIIYLDANNLYVWAMFRALPVGEGLVKKYRGGGPEHLEMSLIKNT